jgi:2-C-methyl-D-erythritol 4-phosphate cytidylyltransferase
VQTPQAFRAAPLLAAYRHAAETGFEGTDTAACLEHGRRHGVADDVVLRAIPGSARNLKVTYAADLPLADRLLADRTDAR